MPIWVTDWKSWEPLAYIHMLNEFFSTKTTTKAVVSKREYRFHRLSRKWQKQRSEITLNNKLKLHGFSPGTPLKNALQNDSQANSISAVLPQHSRNPSATIWTFELMEIRSRGLCHRINTETLHYWWVWEVRLEHNQDHCRYHESVAIPGKNPEHHPPRPSLFPNYNWSLPKWRPGTISAFYTLLIKPDRNLY